MTWTTADIAATASAIGAAVSAIAAVTSLIWAKKVADRQRADDSQRLLETRALEKKQSDDNAQRHKDITELKRQHQEEMDKLQRDLHDITLKFFQRQTIMTLWQHLTELEKIDRDDPAEAVIRRNLNALELLAICRRYEVVDKALLDEALSPMALSVLDDIRAIGKLPSWPGQRNISGIELIESLPTVRELYDIYKETKNPQSAEPLKPRRS